MHLKTLAFMFTLTVFAAANLFAAEEFEPIEKAMKFVHKAPKGEKKVSDRIIDGTSTDEEVAKTLELYKAMLDTKPPKGEPAAYKEKVQKLIVATEHVFEKKEGARLEYKEVVNCKACHADHKPEQQAPIRASPAP